jgi:alkylation response protein AidB-like acyl-CoA dehydrogenase
VGDGWNVAIGTLMHERATLGAGMQITFQRQFDRLVELSHTIKRNGHTAAEDPVMRQKLAQSYIDIEIMRLNQMRAITRINQKGVPGPEGSIQKIFWTELNQRFQQVAAEMLGPYVQLTEGGRAIDDGAWAYSFLRTRGNTIEAGTSEIQRNIVGHFVLGLPKSY